MPAYFITHFGLAAEAVTLEEGSGSGSGLQETAQPILDESHLQPKTNDNHHCTMPTISATCGVTFPGNIGIQE